MLKANKKEKKLFNENSSFSLNRKSMFFEEGCLSDLNKERSMITPPRSNKLKIQLIEAYKQGLKKGLLLKEKKGLTEDEYLIDSACNYAIYAILSCKDGNHVEDSTLAENAAYRIYKSFPDISTKTRNIVFEIVANFCEKHIHGSSSYWKKLLKDGFRRVKGA